MTSPVTTSFMFTTTKGAAPFLLHLFFAAACFSQVSVHITITDSTCSCSSPGTTVFDCKNVLKSAGFTSPSSRQSKKIPNRDVAVILLQKIDSAGFTHAKTDSAHPGTILIFPGSRTSVAKEEISIRSDSNDSMVQIPPSGTFPKLFDAAYITLRQHEIAEAFMNHGYPFVKVTTNIEDPGTGSSVTVRFIVDPDSLYTFASPVISGDFVTRLPILLRDITMYPGTRFSDAARKQTLLRLSSRSYISDVSGSSPEIIPCPPSNDCDTPRLAVPLHIADRSGMGLDGALGLDTRDGGKPQLNGTLEFAFMNLFRSAESAELSYAGDDDRQKLDASLSLPWLFKLPLIVTGSGGLEIEEDFYGYLYSSLGLFYELGIRWLAGFSGTASTTTENRTGGSGTGSFTGFDLSLVKKGESLRDGETSQSFFLTTGSGLSRRDGGFTRSHLDVKLSVHLPTLQHQSVYLNFFTGHMITREQSMVPSEMYRTGGNRTLRGYNEDEFAFKTVLSTQFEYLFYFRKSAAWYFLCDGGAGFLHGIDASRSATMLLGYGAGVRLPVATGTLSVEWARNRSDYRSTGRVHVRLQNALAAAAGSSTFTKGNR